MHVLRLCSVFEADPTSLTGEAAGFDPVGGLQNHTACLTRELDAAGVEQTVVTSRLGGPTGRSRLGRAATLVRVGLRIRRLRQLWALSAVATALRPGRPVDIVHAHQGEDIATLLLAGLAARAHRAPLVVTVHSSVAHTVDGGSPRAVLLRRLGGVVERAALRRAVTVVVLAERSAQFVRADGVPPERVRVIPSGFDPALFNGAHPQQWPGADRPLIGFVGRLVEAKRPDLAVEAFGRMTHDAHLVVVGDGPWRGRVQAAAEASPRSDRITLTGFIEHDRVPDVLATLDVLVLPSTYEELGSVLVEAMASGLPVVATRVGGIPEVVADGETGLLVQPGDVRALAAALDRLVGDEELRRRMAVNARSRAERYGWPSLACRIHELYREATRHVRPAAATTPGR